RRRGKLHLPVQPVGDPGVEPRPDRLPGAAGQRHRVPARVPRGELMPGGLKRGSLGAVGIFLVRRLIYSAVVLFGVLVVTFAILQLVPGDPIRLALGTRYNPEAYRRCSRPPGWTGRCTSSSSPTWPVR